MKIVTKEEWIAALRSGEYRQGQRALHNRQDNSFCCLGVLCEISEMPKNADENFTSYVFPDNAQSFLLPSAGLYNYLGLPYYFNSVANMNDNDKSFNEIADWLERQP